MTAPEFGYRHTKCGEVMDILETVNGLNGTPLNAVFWCPGCISFLRFAMDALAVHTRLERIRNPSTSPTCPKCGSDGLMLFESWLQCGVGACGWRTQDANLIQLAIDRQSIPRLIRDVSP